MILRKLILRIKFPRAHFFWYRGQKKASGFGDKNPHWGVGGGGGSTTDPQN